MSGAKNCPETPRQRMIGMMYLVLTAMLALNVSTDILKGFKMVDTSLHSSIEASEVRNQGLYEDFDYLMTQNAEKTQPWKLKADSIKQKADEAYAFIKQFKYDLAVTADGESKVLKLNPKQDGEDIPDVKNVEADSNLDVGGQLGLVEGRGNQLHDILAAYRDYMIELADADSNKVHSIKSIFNVDDVSYSNDGEPMSWEEGLFDGMPLGAVLTILTKYQNDIRNMEGEMVAFLKNQTDASDFRVNKIEALVVPKSSYVMRGGRYEAQIVLSAVDSTKTPTYFVNGNQLGADGKYTAGCGSTGTFKYRGQILLPRNDGTTTAYPFESEYSVGEPTATISNKDLNVVYRDYDNHFAISVPGISDDQISATADGGTITRSGKEYIVKPGTGNLLKIHVSAKVDGRQQPMGEYEFRIKPLPKPSAFFISGETTFDQVNIPRSAIINPNSHLEVSYGKDGLLNVPFKVTSFMIMTPQGNITGDAGSKFSNAQLEAIKKLKKGDFVNIVNIKATGPNGKPISVAPIPFVLN
ncbi:MAG: gliding motility protein GldM [Paludibacteraceae bacterium]|nr:gliding motility protein GldM [Paludibacteraceae bacterium]